MQKKLIYSGGILLLLVSLYGFVRATMAIFAHDWNLAFEGGSYSWIIFIIAIILLGVIREAYKNEQ